MKKPTILFLVVSLCVLLGDQNSFARDNYKTYEVIEISDNSLTLKNSDRNVINVDKDPEGYRAGYKVRYDSTRKRLKHYRWQDYEVIEVSNSSITLRHETDDEILVQGNFYAKHKVGDQVRYDSVSNKIEPAKDRVRWEEYEVIESSYEKLTLKSKSGKITVLNSRHYPGLYQGGYLGRYEAGDMVRFDPVKNRIKKSGRKTYQWKDYEVVTSSNNSITLRNAQGEELVLQGKYARRYRVGDLVKYDAINDKIKKRRKD